MARDREMEARILDSLNEFPELKEALFGPNPPNDQAGRDMQFDLLAMECQKRYG